MNLQVSIRSEQAAAALLGKTAQLHAAMVRVMTRLSIEIQGNVKGDKLSGQVLHVRTGTLRRSINRAIYDDGVSVQAIIGTNVKYARVHEYGFTGTVNVKEFARKKASGGTTQVKAHTRNVNLPARSFLGSTIIERADYLRSEIRKAAFEALKQ